MTGPVTAAGAAARSTWAERLLWGLIVCGLCAVLATRVIPAMPDDINYLTYFRGVTLARGSNWWAAFLNEPLWLLYTRYMGEAFGAELAFRITLFLSPLVLLASSRRLLGVVAWLFFVYFLIGASIAGGLYATVIRQGFATSVFMGLAMVGLNPILAALIAAGFHSSFLAVVVTIGLVEMFANPRYRTLSLILAALFAIGLLLGVSQIHIALDDPNLQGRRGQTYRGARGLNLLGHLGILLHYGIALGLACPPLKSLLHERYRLYLYAVALSVMTYIAMLVNAGFTRFFLTVKIVVTLALLLRIRSRRGQLALAFWFLGTVVLTINESLTDSPYAWWALWLGILGGR